MRFLQDESKIEFALRVFYRDAGICDRNPKEDVKKLNEERYLAVVTNGGTFIEFVRVPYTLGRRSNMEMIIYELADWTYDFDQVDSAQSVFFSLYRGEERERVE